MQPVLAVHGSMVRLRPLKGSNSSIYLIEFTDRRVFQVIALDGDFLEHPVALNSIVLSAGGRIKVVIDFSDIGPDGQTSLVVDQMGGRNYLAMRISVDRPPETTINIPTALCPLDRIPESEATVTRRFIMEIMDMGMMGQFEIVKGEE